MRHSLFFYWLLEPYAYELVPIFRLIVFNPLKSSHIRFFYTPKALIHNEQLIKPVRKFL